MSNAKKIFEAICLNKYEEIKAFVTEPGREEGLYVDFIRKENFSTTNLSSADKKNYSTALSGFANSDGGVIVWGVVCRKANGVDTASELQPINNVRQFLSNLNSLTGDAVTPLVEGVEHVEILESSEAGCGYVATLIPASDAGPHRAQIKETKQYYKRSGDSFYPMEHYDIEDMFGRRKKPKLSLDIRLADVKKFGDNYRLDLIVSITNAGRGIAKYPFLSLKLLKPYCVSEHGIDGNWNYGLPLLPDSSMQDPKFCGSANDVIHQSITLGITQIRAEIPREIQEDAYVSGTIKDFKAEYELGAEDIMTTKGTCIIRADEIKKYLEKRGFIAGWQKNG